MAQQTAVEWLRKKLEETYDKEGKLPLAYTFSLLNKAEQIEKEQIVKAHGLKYYNHVDEVFSLKTINGEQYYNEVYGGQGSPDTTFSPTKQII